MHDILILFGVGLMFWIASKLQRPRTLMCPICDGDGAVKSRFYPADDHPCERCGGRKVVSA